MKAPVAASMRQGNHGPQARSICKKISPQHAQTGKHEYFLKAEIHGRSKPWEFFTDDQQLPPVHPTLVQATVLAWKQQVGACARLIHGGTSSARWATNQIYRPRCPST